MPGSATCVAPAAAPTALFAAPFAAAPFFSAAAALTLAAGVAAGVAAGAAAGAAVMPASGVACANIIRPGMLPGRRRNEGDTDKAAPKASPRDGHGQNEEQSDTDFQARCHSKKAKVYFLSANNLVGYTGQVSTRRVPQAVASRGDGFPSRPPPIILVGAIDMKSAQGKSSRVHDVNFSCGDISHGECLDARGHVAGGLHAEGPVYSSGHER